MVGSGLWFGARSFCSSMISAQTLGACREGKPVPTFPDHALARGTVSAGEPIIKATRVGIIRQCSFPHPESARSSASRGMGHVHFAILRDAAGVRDRLRLDCE